MSAFIIGLNKELDAVQVSVDGIVINIQRPKTGKFPDSDGIIQLAKNIANEAAGPELPMIMPESLRRRRIASRRK